MNKLKRSVLQEAHDEHKLVTVDLYSRKNYRGFVKSIHDKSIILQLINETGMSNGVKRVRFSSIQSVETKRKTLEKIERTSFENNCDKICPIVSFDLQKFNEKIESLKSGNVIVSVYFNAEDYYSGTIVGYKESEITLLYLDEYDNKCDGVSIIKKECIENIVARGRKADLPLMQIDTAATIVDILQHANANHILIGLKTTVVDWGELIIGYIYSVDEEHVAIHEIDEYGRLIGLTRFKICEIQSVDYGSRYIGYLGTLANNKNSIDEAGRITIWERGNNMIDILHLATTENEIVSLYTDEYTYLCRIYTIGKYEIIVQLVDYDGSFDGICCININDIIGIRRNGLPEQRAMKLLKLNLIKNRKSQVDSKTN